MSDPALVTVTVAAPLVTITKSTPVVVVTTGISGADGPAGEDATVHARRYEESGNYIYAATAPAGSAEAAAVWRITRITYSSGTQTATGVATGVTWTGRVGHSYT